MSRALSPKLIWVEKRCASLRSGSKTHQRMRGNCFCELAAQSFARWRVRFLNEKGEAGPPLAAIFGRNSATYFSNAARSDSLFFCTNRLEREGS